MTYKTRYKIADLTDLEETFNKAYSAADLLSFFEQFKIRAAANPKILQATGNISALNYSGKMFKKNHVAALLDIFNDKSFTIAFYKQQSLLCRNVLNILVWYGETTLHALEHLLKQTISKQNPSYRAHVEPFLLKDGLELILLEKIYDRYSSSREKPKDVIIAFLPKPMEQALRGIIPKPAEYYLTPLAQKPKTAFRHCSEGSALSEINQIIRFINLGHLSLKKNGQATVKGLRELSKAAQFQEFYPDTDISKLKRLKGTMLSTFFLAINLKTTAPNAKPHEIVRKLFQQWLKDPYFTITENFLPHLRVTRNNYTLYYDTTEINIKKNLNLILQKMPKDGWISLPDILSFNVVRQINLLEFDRKLLDYRHYEETEYGDWEDWYGINQVNINEVVSLPLLKSFFFLAAALGLVEIGYDIPDNPDFKRKNCAYLSPYDGLKRVKLTPLGEFVSGKTKKYSADTPEITTCQLHLDSTRLLLTMEGIDPIATLNLQKVMEPAGSGRFILTHASLLKECRNKEDVTNKIALFKETISQQLPKIWSAFFKIALERVDPLQADPNFRVFKIFQNQELLHILTSDPDISALILKVEGLRIAVELPHVSKLIRLLKGHGYLVNKDALVWEN